MVVFSEVVTGFDQSELGVSGTSGATIAAWDAQTNATPTTLRLSHPPKREQQSSTSPQMSPKTKQRMTTPPPLRRQLPLTWIYRVSVLRGHLTYRMVHLM